MDGSCLRRAGYCDAATAVWTEGVPCKTGVLLIGYTNRSASVADRSIEISQFRNLAVSGDINLFDLLHLQLPTIPLRNVILARAT